MDNVPMNLDGSWKDRDSCWGFVESAVLVCAVSSEIAVAKDYHPLTVEEAADTTDLQNRRAHEPDRLPV